MLKIVNISVNFEDRSKFCKITEIRYKLCKWEPRNPPCNRASASGSLMG